MKILSATRMGEGHCMIEIKRWWGSQLRECIKLRVIAAAKRWFLIDTAEALGIHANEVINRFLEIEALNIKTGHWNGVLADAPEVCDCVKCIDARNSAVHNWAD